MSSKDIAEQSKPITVRELEEIRRQYPINEFEMRGRGSSNTKVLSSTNNSITQHETQHQSGSALMPNQGEAFEIPANDGLFVIHQDSTDIEHEAVKPSQEELIQQLNTIDTQIDTEEVFVGRIRTQLIKNENWVSMWIVADNVYGKGAALNAVQIIETLIEHKKLC